MTVYSVTSEFYDNGKTKAYMRTYELDSVPQSKEISTPRCDIYVDYFTDKALAIKCVDDTRRA